MHIVVAEVIGNTSLLNIKISHGQHIAPITKLIL